MGFLKNFSTPVEIMVDLKRINLTSQIIAWKTSVENSGVTGALTYEIDDMCREFKCSFQDLLMVMNDVPGMRFIHIK